MPASDTEMQDAPASSQDESAQATAGAQDRPDESDPNDAEADYDIQDGYQHSQRIRVLPGDSETAASFEFTNEDHTLGNALRHIIMKNPQVEFCGYSIPHPADPKMNLRIQTYDDVSVYEVLDKGLKDLMDACDVVLDKFKTARDDFGKRSQS